jgi:murein DD-endopeptidase MepM/ murein hydrolase activator NlpD
MYAEHGDPVYAVEDGVVVGVEHFTGPQDDSPWWQDTDAVLVEGKTGVVCYGEVTPKVEVGEEVKRGEIIAFVSTVLHEGKERPDIPGHSRSMLHMELYAHGTKASTSWDQGRRELGMRDPTPHLLKAEWCPDVLTWQ